MSTSWKKRPGVIVLAALIPAWVAWTVFSLCVAPGLVSDAYDQKSWPVLNQLISGRDLYPKQVYLDKWEAWAWASQLAAAGLLAVVLVLFGPKATRAFPRQARESETSYRARRVALVVITGIALVLTIWAGPRLDYAEHMRMWDVVRAGGDPWAAATGNAYGPLFNVLVVLYLISPLGPKVLYCIVWCFIAVWLLGRLGAGRRFWIGLCAWFGTPSFWVMIPFFGMFDVLCATGITGAVWLRRRGQDLGAGIALGAATLFKLYPVFALPGVVLDRGRVRWRVMAGWAVTVSAGYAAGLAIWGQSVFRPFVFAAEREPKLLSVFRFVVSEYSPLRPLTVGMSLDRYSLPLMAVSVAVISVYCYSRRVAAAPASLASMTAALAAYKVGHSQFQVVVLVLLAYWFVTEQSRFRSGWMLSTMALLYVSFIGLFDGFYLFTNGYHDRSWLFVRETVGVVAFPLAVGLVVAVLRAAAELSESNSLPPTADACKKRECVV